MAIKVQVVDALGAELKKGDNIAYPVRRGSKLWMTSGRIESISGKIVGQGHTEVVAKVMTAEGRRVSFKAFNRAVRLA